MHCFSIHGLEKTSTWISIFNPVKVYFIKPKCWTIKNKCYVLSLLTKFSWDLTSGSRYRARMRRELTHVLPGSFFSSESILHIYISNIRPCVEYYCNIWSGVPILSREILDNNTKTVLWFYRSCPDNSTSVPSHGRNMAYLCLFCKCLHGNRSIFSTTLILRVLLDWNYSQVR